MIRRPLVLALVLALAPVAASAEDLLQVYSLARDNDPQLAASQSNRLAVREGEVQARAALLPQINGTASYSKSRSDGSSTQTQLDTNTGQLVTFASDSSGTTTSHSLGVDVSQMVFDRSRFTVLKSEQALSRASDFNLQAADDSLITRTSAAYFNTLVAIETLTAAEASEAALKKQFEAASKRLEVGLAPITDVHEARAQYDSARANTIVARNAVLDSYQALAEITGKPPGALKALPENFQPTLPEHGNAESFVSRAVENNPSLHAAEEQLASANENVETARSGHWPTLYLNGSYGDRNSTTDGTFQRLGVTSPSDTQNQSRGPSVGVTLNVPIFSGGATSSRVRQALANRDVVADQVEQQRRALIRNTNAAYQALAAGITEVESRRAALISARAAFEASQVGLEVGTRTVLDVLNNQQNVFVAQRLYSQARYTFLQARLLLAQSVGTLGLDDLQEVNRLLTVTAPTPVALTP
ncbi:TolC family outer membrane protein [Lysobacter sp. HA35]